MESRIILSDMRFYAHHGVLPQETVVGNNYTVSLELAVDNTKAMNSDALEDTIDYSAVYDIVKAEMQVPSKLLEHVCGRIVKHLFSSFREIISINICIDKLNPPMGADIRSAGVRALVSRREADIIL